MIYFFKNTMKLLKLTKRIFYRQNIINRSLKKLKIYQKILSIKTKMIKLKNWNSNCKIKDIYSCVVVANILKILLLLNVITRFVSIALKNKSN